MRRREFIAGFGGAVTATAGSTYCGSRVFDPFRPFASIQCCGREAYFLSHQNPRLSGCDASFRTWGGHEAAVVTGDGLLFYGADPIDHRLQE
jgi:hypothetical protein